MNDEEREMAREREKGRKREHGKELRKGKGNVVERSAIE